MKSWQFTLIGLALLAVAGCRSDPNIGPLERELRLQEDELYRLQECIEDYRISLESARRESAVLRKRLEAEQNEQDEPDESTDKLVPPSIELPPEPPSGGKVHGIIEQSDKVSQLMLDRQLTGGYNADGQPGDEGIVVYLQTRDAAGRSVAVPGEVSVVVLDPALDGEAARVARWDFTAQQTAEALRRQGPGRAMQLEMVWPAAPPIHGELHLYVRYTTSDGRKLQVDGPIQVELPDGHATTWTPVEPRPEALQASRPAFQRPPVWSPDRE